MTTLEQTISLIKTLPPEELSKAEKYIRKLCAKSAKQDEAYNYENTPEFRKRFPKLTKEQFMVQLQESEEQVRRGEYRDAFEAVEEVRQKYGV